MKNQMRKNYTSASRSSILKLLNYYNQNTKMIDSEKLAKKVSQYIEKNLRGKTPFKSTSDFISYIAEKENKKKSE